MKMSDVRQQLLEWRKKIIKDRERKRGPGETKLMHTKCASASLRQE